MVTTGIIRRPAREPGTLREKRPASSDTNLTTRAHEGEDNSLSIVFELSSNTMVTLAIFNTDGRLVDILFEGWLWPGRHEVKYCLKGHSPGQYKCLLDTPTVRLVKFIDVQAL